MDEESGVGIVEGRQKEEEDYTDNIEDFPYNEIFSKNSQHFCIKQAGGTIKQERFCADTFVYNALFKIYNLRYQDNQLFMIMQATLFSK